MNETKRSSTASNQKLKKKGSIALLTGILALSILPLIPNIEPALDLLHHRRTLQQHHFHLRLVCSKSKRPSSCHRQTRLHSRIRYIQLTAPRRPTYLLINLRATGSAPSNSSFAMMFLRKRSWSESRLAHPNHPDGLPLKLRSFRSTRLTGGQLKVHLGIPMKESSKIVHVPGVSQIGTRQPGNKDRASQNQISNGFRIIFRGGYFMVRLPLGHTATPLKHVPGC